MLKSAHYTKACCTLYLNPPPLKMTIYLASQSPRRAELLQQIGVEFRLLLAQTQAEKQAAEDLEMVLVAEAPAAYVQRVTALKAQAAYARWQALAAQDGAAWPALPILCADTTVALGTQILGKPVDAADAAAMLGQLAGQTHEVLTALAVVNRTGELHTALSRSQVQFKALSAAEIAAYVASGEPMGKAGSYGIQGRAAAFVQQMAGSYTGIVGLPLFETAQLLSQVRA
jgi:septum formation protein